MFDIMGGGVFSGAKLGGLSDPICFGLHLLVRVNLGYTPNFTFLGILEVP